MYDAPKPPHGKAHPGQLAGFLDRRSRVLAYSGWSLLEVVLVCAIVALLGTYAVPLYRGHLERGHYIGAATAVYRAAHFVAASEVATGAPAALALPPGLDQAPPDGRAVYRLRILPVDATNGGHTIEARPVSPGSMQADEQCGWFRLDATGRRTNQLAAGQPPQFIGRCWGASG